MIDLIFTDAYRTLEGSIIALPTDKVNCLLEPAAFIRFR